MKNKIAFIALIKKYRKMTPKHIEAYQIKHNDDFLLVGARRLTGFGSFSTCTLCKAVTNMNRRACEECAWLDLTHHFCLAGPNRVTYHAILDAATTEALSAAYQNRADRMVYLLWSNELISEELYLQLKNKAK